MIQATLILGYFWDDGNTTSGDGWSWCIASKKSSVKVFYYTQIVLQN